MVTKTKIKNLCSNRLKLNKEEIIEQIQYYAKAYIDGGDVKAKHIVVTLFNVLGLKPDDADAAFETLIDE